MPDSAIATDIDPANPDHFTIWSVDRLRWGDMDSMGHVNNVQIARFAESGRIFYISHFQDLLAKSNTFCTLARLVVNFRVEMQYPGEVRVGTRLVKVGRSSFDLIQGMFKDDICTATTQAVMVLIDRDHRKPCRIPGELRDHLLRPAP